MDQLIQFFCNHWVLWLTLLFILILIFINEMLAQKKQAKQVSPQAAIDLINHQQAVVIDLRDTELFNKGHIIDSVRVSADDFQKKSMDKYKNKLLVLVCARGQQSQTLAVTLREQGYVNTMVLAGGIAAWQAENLPLVKKK